VTFTAHSAQACKKPISSIPYPPDPHFVGRAEILLEIEESLRSHGSIALSGTGGVGYVAVDLRLTSRERSDIVLQEITDSHRVLLAI
jgi:hypothetical protein